MLAIVFLSYVYYRSETQHEEDQNKQMLSTSIDSQKEFSKIKVSFEWQDAWKEGGKKLIVTAENNSEYRFKGTIKVVGKSYRDETIDSGTLFLDDDIGLAPDGGERFALLWFKNPEAISTLSYLIRGSFQAEPKLPELAKIKPVADPIFGILLGEDITDLKKRYPIKTIPANEDKETVTKVYIVGEKSSEVKALQVLCFNGKVYDIVVFLADNSESNCNIMVKKIKAEYKIIKESVTEQPISLGIYKCSDREYDFLVRIDGEDVGINVLFSEMPKEAGGNDLSVSYTYNKLKGLVPRNQK